ncbi:CRISPR-associated endonuclease Cas6 [Methanosalsum natronophilum]|uniref:CRISPR-associated endonuclease Cas6 n=1 Tax=Methanosalsum natronophilum TaxID=768733 RepID=UPI002169362E|nr:CRISPR-associated endonuclease Cas6 [Methanosalsum natronophilum]MCS3923888.1 hypothetical protein [Methanosalsum natronophilum]
MLVDIVIIKLFTVPHFRGNAAQLRGYIATKFNEYELLHQHRADKVLYTYPRVQYKVIENIPMLVAIEEGVNVLQDIYGELNEIKTMNNTYKITSKQIIAEKREFGLAREQNRYEFVTPWFGLNQTNFKNKYLKVSDEERASILRKTITGNLLALSKSLGYYVSEEVKCNTYLRAMPTRFKGETIVTFKGHFNTNFVIPDYQGLGKSVSRGFGTVKLCNL